MKINAMFVYNTNSEGSKELRDAFSEAGMKVPRIAHKGSKFKSDKDKVVLNWGSSTERWPEYLNACKIINPPSVVDKAINKINALEAFKKSKVSHPEFTTSAVKARGWVEDGEMVFARTRLTSHSGRGIVIMDPEHSDTWDVTAPLYVKYIPKKDEYRVHVVNKQVIDVQRKGLRAEFKGHADVNFKIRNLANGFIYVRNDGREVPKCVLDTAVSGIEALNLDFGAADILYNQKQNKAYIIEVNTAPGLAGTTVRNYVNAFVNM